MNVHYVPVTIGKFKSSLNLLEINRVFRKWLDLINQQQVGKDIHETFHRDLDEKSDKFGVIADYLGRRLFD